MEFKKIRFDREIERNYRIEVLLSNVLDKDVQTMLLPLNVMQILVLNPKYIIKNHFISPHNRCNKFILICGVVIYLVAYVYRLNEILLDPNMMRYRAIDFLYYAFLFDVFWYCIGFVMNFILHLTQVKSNIQFVLTFQEVHRFLNNKASFKWSIISTWMYVVIIFGFYILTLTVMYLLYLKVPWNVIFNLLILVVLDTNIIYAIALMKFLTDKIVIWNELVVHSHQNAFSEMDHPKAFHAYVQILKCYKIYKNIFQQSILYQTIETFSHTLVNVQVLIEFLKQSFQHQVATPLVWVILCLCMVKFLVLQITLSLQVEAFYEAVKNSQDTCALILASNCTDDEKKLCKNVLRLHRASFSKMTACGLFYVDICQPLRLMALLTNYTVVLLQFAFL